VIKNDAKFFTAFSNQFFTVKTKHLSGMHFMFPQKVHAHLRVTLHIDLIIFLY